MFDFDRVIDRRGTHSAKWDSIVKLSGIEAPSRRIGVRVNFRTPPLVCLAQRGKNPL
jgi:hypothetical protein